MKRTRKQTEMHSFCETAQERGIANKVTFAHKNVQVHEDQGGEPDGGVWLACWKRKLRITLFLV